jgi:hypothetical protein
MSATRARGEPGRGNDECSTKEQTTGEGYDLRIRHN